MGIKDPEEQNGVILGLCQDLRSNTFDEEGLSEHYKILRILGQGALREVKFNNDLLREAMEAVKILTKWRKNTLIKSDWNDKNSIPLSIIIKLLHIIDKNIYM